MHEPEFFRTGQKCYLRTESDTSATKSYEYQMFQHNRISSFLNFREWNVNGQEYLYYEVSGMQSLDIYIQTRKLQRTFALKLIKALQKLCNDLSEYALQIENIQFNPKYIMLDSSEENIYFLYQFQSEGDIYTALEKLLECCIENLNYEDELLTENIYGIYESLLAQGKNFFLKSEMDKAADSLEALPDAKKETEEIVIKEYETPTSETPTVSKVAQREYKKLKRGIYILLLLDVLLVVFWKPLTLLKIFFCIAIGLVFSGLSIYLKYQEQKKKEELKEKQQEGVFLEEYKYISSFAEDNEGATQLICLENTEGVLYSLNGEEPICIYIDETGQIIGKDGKKAQIHINKKSISRIHAFVIKKEKECFVEDLNSTNGTWVNGKMIIPRTRYVLKQGDKVCFADQEYIFR